MSRFRDRLGVAATKGFFNEVANPSAKGSLTGPNGPSYNSAEYGINIPLAVGVTSVSVPIPSWAYLVDAVVAVTTPFSAGATVKVGSTAGGNDLLPAQALTSAGATLIPIALPQAFNVSNPVGTSSVNIFVTLSGSPAAGVGNLILRYLNPNPYSTIFNPVADPNQLT